jgi:hypothetical protein
VQTLIFMIVDHGRLTTKDLLQDDITVTTDGPTGMRSSLMTARTTNDDLGTNYVTCWLACGLV